MASGLLMLEGFEALGIIADRYAQVNASSTCGTSWGRFGGKGATMAYYRMLRYQPQATYTHLIVGFAWRSMDTGPMMTFYDSDAGQHHGSLYTNETAGTVSYYRGFGSTHLGTSASMVFKPGTWNYMEVRVKFDNSVGEVEIKINGTQVLNLTSQDTTNSANAYATEVWFGNCDAIDDVYVVDKTVSGATFLGDIKVVGLLPSGDSSVAWTKSGGATNASCVDETDVNQDTDYVSTTSTSVIDLYTLPDLSGTPTIKGVEVVSTAKRDNTQAATMRNLLKSSGGTTTLGSTISLGIDYTIVRGMFENVPGGTGWTHTDVNGLLVGVDRVS